MSRAPLRLLTPETEVEQVRGFLGESDRRWRQRHTVIEVASAAANTDKLAIGSTPWLGDYAGTALEVPLAATSGQANRYLFRLCGIAIPYGSCIRIVGVRQLATVRAGFQAEEGGNTYFVEREIVSPLWSFIDGNISWHMRWQTKRMHRYAWDPAGQVAGTSRNLNGRDSALLYRSTLVPYTVPGQGLPPGRDVPYLGTWRDMRYPWDSPSWDLNTVVAGPGTVVFYASVHQTNPDTRFRFPPIADPGALRPEDRFLQAYPLNAVYGHVGGAFTVEMLTG